VTCESQTLVETNGARQWILKANFTQSRLILVSISITLLLGSYLAFDCVIPLRTSVQIGGDEGFELAKAVLWTKGYKLYEQVWNDQPPLHTWILTKVLRHTHAGPKSTTENEGGASHQSESSTVRTETHGVLAPRLISMIFGILLVVSLFSMVLRLNGLAVAVLGCAMFICAPGFLGMSASCMLEVPAFATAVTSIALLVHGARIGTGIRKEWLITTFAGAVFGAAIMMKLVPLMLAPVIAFILLARQGSSKIPLRRTIMWLFLFGLAAMAAFIALDFLIEGGAFLRHFQQTWTSHFGTQQSFEYGSPKDHPFEWPLLLKHWDATIPAVLGICLIAGSFFRVRKETTADSPQFRLGLHLLPAIWLLYSLAVFAVHKPWWSYYYVHLAVPLCWCAAVGIMFVVKKCFETSSHHKLRTVLVSLVLIAAAVWTCGRVYLQIGSIRSAPRIYSDLVIPEISRFKPFTQWLYADEPIYSFHSGIPFPPNLAVIMYKRLWSGDMTNEKITAELTSIKPGLILLKQDTRVVPFKDLLETEYRLVYYDSLHRLYAHQSIAKKPAF
jgi:hypothetical protein